MSRPDEVTPRLTKAQRRAQHVAEMEAARARKEARRAAQAEQEEIARQRREAGIPTAAEREAERQWRQNEDWQHRDRILARCIEKMRADRARAMERRDYLLNLLRLYELWRERTGRPIAYVQPPSERRAA